MRACLIKLLFYCFAALPLPAGHFLGSLIGWLLYLIPNDLRRISSINLDLCFPAMDARERQRLLRRSLIETAKTGVEMGPLWLWGKERILSLVRKVSGEEVVSGALGRGKGIILASPHLGAWEMAGLYCSVKYPLTSLYRPPRMAALNGMMRRSRERFGARLAPTTASGIRALYAALGRKEAVGILPDQEPRGGTGAFASFFGVPAYTMLLMQRLSARTGAPIVYVYAERLPRGAGYHLHFLQLSRYSGFEDQEGPARMINEDVETCVRSRPEQYQWCYKRFRTRPPGLAKVY